MALGCEHCGESNIGPNHDGVDAMAPEEWQAKHGPGICTPAGSGGEADARGSLEAIEEAATAAIREAAPFGMVLDAKHLLAKKWLREEKLSGFKPLQQAYAEARAEVAERVGPERSAGSPLPDDDEPLMPVKFSADQGECNHGCVFDKAAARNLSVEDIRKRWPRFFGTCSHCGYKGIYYASTAHYVMGDW